MRTIVKRNKGAINKAPPVPPYTTGVSFNPGLHKFFFICSGELNNRLAERWAKDSCRDSAGDKVDSSFAKPSLLAPLPLCPKQYSVTASCSVRGICSFWELLVNTGSDASSVQILSKVYGETQRLSRNLSGRCGFSTSSTWRI
jgi:hypothetical protein